MSLQNLANLERDYFAVQAITVRNPKPETRNPKPGTVQAITVRASVPLGYETSGLRTAVEANPNPGTRTPEPGSWNLKPETRNPSTRDLKRGTVQAITVRARVPLGLRFEAHNEARGGAPCVRDVEAYVHKHGILKK
jgi:hypothetical protein